MANHITLDKIDLDLIELLKKNSEGLRVNIILKNLNLRRRSLYNRLEKLKKEKILENIYPIWRFADFQMSYLNLAHSSDKKIQSHKFSFVLKLIQKPTSWDKHENRLILMQGLDNNAKTTKWGNSKYTKITLNQFIIHFFPDTILFINQKKYFSHEPYLALQSALEDTLRVLERIEDKVKFKFFLNEVPQFKIKTNHYVKLDDEIAKRCKESNNILRVEIGGILRAWVDLSEPFGLETGNKDHGVEDMDRYKRQVEDIIKNNPPTNSELLVLLNEELKVLLKQGENITNQTELNKEILLVQNEFKENLQLHMEVLKDMSITLKGIDNAIGTLVNFNNKEIKLYKTIEKRYKHKLNGKQTTLF